MGKTIYPLTNLDIYPTVRSDNVAKVVVNDDYVGYGVKTKTHLFGV